MLEMLKHIGYIMDTVVKRENDFEILDEERESEREVRSASE